MIVSCRRIRRVTLLIFSILWTVPTFDPLSSKGDAFYGCVLNSTCTIIMILFTFICTNVQFIFTLITLGIGAVPEECSITSLTMPLQTAHHSDQKNTKWSVSRVILHATHQSLFSRICTGKTPITNCEICPKREITTFWETICSTTSVEAGIS